MLTMLIARVSYGDTLLEKMFYAFFSSLICGGTMLLLYAAYRAAKKKFAKKQPPKDFSLPKHLETSFAAASLLSVSSASENGSPFLIADFAISNRSEQALPIKIYLFTESGEEIRPYRIPASSVPSGESLELSVKFKTAVTSGSLLLDVNHETLDFDFSVHHTQ